MDKTEKIYLSYLRNDEHFQFNTEFINLVNASGAAALRVEPQFQIYLPLYAQEDEAIKKIMKSAITADMQAKDRRRDMTFRGMIDANKSALNHFREEVVTAAQRLKILFDTYGNVAQKPLDEETSAIYNLMQELRGKYAADVQTVGIADWADELEANNREFEALTRERYDETAARTTVVLRDARAQLDAAYRAITDRIDAQTLLEESPQCAEFIRKLNVVVKNFNNKVAQRKGKKNNG